MGLRGPGARKAPKADAEQKAKRAKKPAWEKRGLTRAERVVRFIEQLKITAGAHAGKSFILRPWQVEVIDAIYATNDDGKRKVRQAVLTWPRKQGKTALAAALALCHLCGPEAEQRGQVFSAAADRAQASLLFNEMKAMVLADEGLSERIVIREHNKTLEDRETGSIYMALSSDSNTKHGLSASCIIYDELAQAPNRDLYDVLRTSTAARAEPLLLVISTMSADPHHIMSELVDYGSKVNDGTVDDPTFYACIYTAPMDADPWAEETWYACNPALGDFRSLEEMRSTALQAQRIPAQEASFRLLYLNQPVEADDKFIPKAEWDACYSEFDAESLYGRPCYAGFDLSSTTDLTAFVLFFPEDGGAILPFCWAPADRLLEKEDRDRVPYPLWAKQGHLLTTPGRAIDKHFVARDVADIISKFDVQMCAFDRWGFEDLQKIFVDEGIELPVTPFGQGFKDMGPAVNALEAAILSRKFRHNNHPILNWCMSNIKIATDPAGARKFDKGRAVDRIDLAVAGLMGVGIWAKTPKQEVKDFKFSGWL